MAETTRMRLAMAVALHLGAKGRRGGWVYLNGRPACQGWDAWLMLCERRGWIVDRGEPFAPHVDWRKVPHPAWQGNG